MGVATAARPHLPGRCPDAESRASLSEVELSWSTAQAALKAAASSSMGAGGRAGAGAGSRAVPGARSRAGGDEWAPEPGRSARRLSRSCRRRRRCRALPEAGGPAGARLEAPGCHGNGGGGRGARGGGEAGRRRGGGARTGRDPGPAGADCSRDLPPGLRVPPHRARARPREWGRQVGWGPPTCAFTSRPLLVVWRGLPQLAPRTWKVRAT